MINRINLILQAKNITAKQFAEEIGIQPSGMSHILSGRNNPSLEFINKVIRRYPEIDANWLLLGKGQMYGELGIKNEEFAPLRSQAVSPLEPGRGMRNEESLSEPTLFSVPEASPSPAPAYTPALEPTPEPEPIPEPMEECEEVCEQEKEELKNEPASIKNDGRRLLKILFFYDDHTFEEYRPLAHGFFQK